MLNLLVHAGVGDCCPVYSDVIVVTEVQELLSNKLLVIVSNDIIGDPKVENNVLDKACRFFGANFGHGLSLDLLGELVDHDKQVGEALGQVFKGSQEVQTPHNKGPCDRDGLEHLGWHVDLPHKVLAPFARPHNLSRVVNDRWPVKTLPEGFADHAP
jgi:hypothetical protein